MYGQNHKLIMKHFLITV